MAVSFQEPPIHISKAQLFKLDTVKYYATNRVIKVTHSHVERFPWFWQKAQKFVFSLFKSETDKDIGKEKKILLKDHYLEVNYYAKKHESAWQFVNLGGWNHSFLNPNNQLCWWNVLIILFGEHVKLLNQCFLGTRS
jgi:hypothetical protein